MAAGGPATSGFPPDPQHCRDVLSCDAFASRVSLPEPHRREVLSCAASANTYFLPDPQRCDVLNAQQASAKDFAIAPSVSSIPVSIL
jgi:hypothetical protein